MIERLPTLVVFGLDSEGHPRAGKFSSDDAELAVKAASFLGYRVTHIGDPAITAQLRNGDVFARGHGLIGRVTQTLFNNVSAVANKRCRR
jgi:hypothetical protein